MANTKLIKLTIQFRRDTTANWELHKDIVPAAGEPCFDLDKSTLKIGDGVTTYEKLKEIGGVDIAADGKSIVMTDGTFKLAGFDAAEVGAQPRKNAEGNIEWIVPSTETVDGLKAAVAGLQSDVKTIQDIVAPSEEGKQPLLTRVETLEEQMNGKGENSVDKKIDAKINEFATNITDDEVVNSYKELIDYVANHGGEAATLAADITLLQSLVGDDPVRDQIAYAVNNSGHITKKEAETTLMSKIESTRVFENIKYEIVSKPEGAIVDYRESEIRVLCPSDTKWAKQTVGGTGNANMYYMGFRAYAPAGAASFKEGDRGVVVDEMFDFNGDFAGTDEFGRKYSICWLALASYNEATDTWSYFGEKSTTQKYVGWDYIVEWYDESGKKIDSDCIRINLSNEACHNNIEPFYMASVIKEVAVNGTVLGLVNGRVDITVPEIKGSDEIVVAKDGTLGIGTINIDKIVQSEDSILVLDGGASA